MIQIRTQTTEKHLFLPKVVLRIVFLLSLLFICYTTIAQDSKEIDSLQRELLKAKDDTNKTKLYYRLWQQYRLNDLKLADKYAREGLVHAQKLKWKKGIAAFYTSLGENYDFQRINDSVLIYFDKALVLYKSMDYPKGLAGIYNNYSTYYGNRGFHIEAIDYALKSIEISERIKDTNNIIYNYNNISTFYFDQQNYAKAKEYVNKALALASRNGTPQTIGGAQLQLAFIYFSEKDTLKSLQYFEKSLENYKTSNHLSGVATVYMNMAVLQKNQIDKLKLAFKARKIFDELQIPHHPTSITNYGNIGYTYFEIAQDKALLGTDKLIPKTAKETFLLAKNYLEKAVSLSREAEDYVNLQHFLKSLAELEEYNHNYTAALQHFKEGYTIQDSLFSQENKNRIAELESQKALDERDKRISINELQLQSAKRIRIGLIVGAILLTIIGGLLFYQNRVRRRTNVELKKLNQELEEANRVKTQFFGILSHDLRKPASNLIHFLHLQKEHPELLDREIVEKQQNKIEHAAENLLETLETVLLWSKSQMERFEPQKKLVPIDSLFTYLKKCFSDEAVAISYLSAENIQIHTDENYLQTILYNLTTNALKAVEKVASPSIRWKAEQVEKYVFLKIQDNGKGLTANQKDILYNKEASIANKSGFGLHLIRDLAEAIDCKIEVQSEEGEGTVIILRL